MSSSNPCRPNFAASEFSVTPSYFFPTRCHNPRRTQGDRDRGRDRVSLLGFAETLSPSLLKDSSLFLYRKMSSGKTPEMSPRENDDIHEHFFVNRRCCSWVPCLGSERVCTDGSNWWERIRTAESEDRWWMRGWKNFRGWSELVAGPKWKTFIRRFSRNRAGPGGYNRQGKFQYDPTSYSLNFDEGPGQNNQLNEDYWGRDFSCRYASIPASAKSSMDLGKDAPSFT